MRNQFFKAIALVIFTSSATYLTLTTFNDNQDNKSGAEVSNDLEKIVTPSTSSKDSAKESTLDLNHSFLKGTEEPTTKPQENSEQDKVISSLPETTKQSKQIESAINEATETQELSQKNTTIEQAAEDNVPLQISEIKSEQKPQPSFNTSALENLAAIDVDIEAVKTFCKDLSKKLRTVKYDGCMQLELGVENNFKSVQNRSLTYRHFRPKNLKSLHFSTENKQTGRILFISGIHGDEYSAISITYLWMLNMLKYQDKTTQHWLFLPLTNPDGLYRKPATRINANNVDLNRNFPSPDWDELALDYWKKYYKRNKRRFPGNQANSEPETQWLVHLIDEFKPDAIISVHAPYGLVDYDGPEYAIPNKIGALKHRELGTYPGSLGRYAGEYLKIPVLTLELRAAGSMPTDEEIYHMWRDVEEWTNTKVRGEIPGPIPRFKKSAE